jgi:hypothetical protein
VYNTYAQYSHIDVLEHTCYNLMSLDGWQIQPDDVELTLPVTIHA